jgi:hypothetical protein
MLLRSRPGAQGLITREVLAEALHERGPAGLYPYLGSRWQGEFPAAVAGLLSWLRHEDYLPEHMADVTALKRELDNLELQIADARLRLRVASLYRPASA